VKHTSCWLPQDTRGSYLRATHSPHGRVTRNPLRQAHGARAAPVTRHGSLGDATSSLGDARSSLGDAESSLGDAESSLGDAESSLGDQS
jgi:hypothetical protein